MERAEPRGKLKKDLSEFLGLMRLMSPRHWHRLVGFAGARILNKLHLHLTSPIVLPLRLVNAWATPAGPCGLGFLVENAGGQIYDRFSTSSGPLLLFDVGANAGFVSLIRCRQNPLLRAICFEPHPDTFRVLENNVAVNYLQDRVRVLNVAVGAESGSLRILQAEGDSMLAVSETCLPANVPIREITVPVISLDDYCEEHNLWPEALKIDVEGHEQQVLLGARRVLDRARHVVMEWHSETLRENCSQMLNDRGFEVAEQGDLIFASRPGTL
jgi:FkbM family methyltransferase